MTPACECHDVPMYWKRDPRRKVGGYWRCREVHNFNGREYRQRHLEVVRARQRDQKIHRYDTDPIYRITKNLRDNERARAKRLERQRNRLEAMRGEV